MKFSEFLNAINIFKKMGGKDEEIDTLAQGGSGCQPLDKRQDAASTSTKTFTEADIEAAKMQAAADARAKTLAESQATFAEAEKQRAFAARKEQIKAFCDAGIAAGKIAPAWISAGIAKFMEQLAAEEQAAIVFCEGAGKKTPAAWFAEFLDGLPTLINFEEIATRDKDVGAGGAGEKLAALVAQKRKDNPKLDYSAAFAEAQTEHPDLALEYQASLRS